MGIRRPKKSTSDNPPPPAGEAQVSLRLDADNAEQDAALTAAAERVKAAAAKTSKPKPKPAETAGDAQATEVGDAAAPKRRRRPAKTAATESTAETRAVETKAAETKAADPEPAVEAPKPLVSRAAPPSLQNFIGSTRDTQEGVISRVKRSMGQWAPPAPAKPDSPPAKPATSTLERLEEDKQLMYGEGVLALRLQKALKGAQKQVENAPPKAAPAPEPKSDATPSWMPKEAPQRSFPTRTSTYDVTRPVETKEPPKAEPAEPKKVAEKKPEGDKKAPYFKPITGPAAVVGKLGKKAGGAVGYGLDAAYRRLPNYAANIATASVGGPLIYYGGSLVAKVIRESNRNYRGEPAKEEKKQEGGTEEIPKPAATEPVKPVGTPARKLSSDVFKKNKPAVNTGSSILRNLRGQA